MSSAEQQIRTLDREVKNTVCKLFGTTDCFYQTFYLLIQNEHQLDQFRPEGWAARLSSSQYYRRLVTERVIKVCKISGDLIDDIYSDYFEDFANYRERNFNFSNEDFISVVKKIIT